MDARILYDLRDYLNDRTMPGKPYQVGPGLAWSVILPKQDYAEDLKAVLGDPRLRTMVGTILASGSRRLATARNAYGPDQPRGGAYREMTTYLSVFTRSLKTVAYDGELLLIEDLLQELVGDFSSKDSPNAQAAGLDDMQVLHLPPDFTVLEFTGRLVYATRSMDDAAARLKAIQLGGNLMQFTDNLAP